MKHIYPFTLFVRKQHEEVNFSADGFVKILADKGHEILVQSNGGFEAGFTNEDYEKAKISLKSPIQISDENLSEGKELYGIYCAVCHGSKGDGQGILMTREKFLGIPSYKDREITPGSIYHVLMYGKNAMGSHAGQVNKVERWQIAQYVMQLRNNLIKN